MIDLGELAFTAEDLECVEACDASNMAIEVNRILKTKLEKAPVVYGVQYDDGSGCWETKSPGIECSSVHDVHGDYNHTARLVCVTEVKG